MKTAMQELLKEVNKERENSTNVDFREALDFVRSAIEKDYLATEKEQIIEAYNKGNVDGIRWAKDGIEEFESAEDYYNQNFKND